MSDQLQIDLDSLRIDRSRDASPTGPRWALRLGFAALVVAAALGAFTAGWPLLESKVFKTEVVVTEIAAVSPAQATVELTSTGYLIAQTRASVGSKVPGRISRVFVKQGSQVQAGEPLFQLDPVDELASVATAASQATAARARTAAARATLREVELKAGRARQLASKGAGPVADAEELEAHADALREQVNVSSAEAGATVALVSQLRVHLMAYTVKAPIAGRVLSKPPEVGECVGPQPAGLAVNMGGVDIADLSTLMAEVDVPEARLGLVKHGGPTEIVLDAYPERRFRGRTSEIVPGVNRSKSTVTVKVAFVDAMAGALPDMAARVSFLRAELDAEAVKVASKIIVPSGAVSYVDGASIVFAVVDGKVRRTPVSLGPAFGNGFELKSGPRPGTRVVKDPPRGLADGQSVKERFEG